MLLAAHTLAGAAVGEVIDNPFLAFLLGVVAHFCLDAVPHYDTTDNGKYTLRQIVLASVDFLIGVFILTYIILNSSQNHTISILAGGFGGILPDLISNPPFMRRLLNRTMLGQKFVTLHTNIQKINLPVIPGLAVQIMIWAISMYLLCKF